MGVSSKLESLAPHTFLSANNTKTLRNHHDVFGSARMNSGAVASLCKAVGVNE